MNFNINKKLLLLKAYYFFCLAGISPIAPFVTVILKQIGIPVHVHGTVALIVFFIGLLAKPFIGVAADAFPKARKLMFISYVVIMHAGFASLCFLPNMQNDISLSGTVSFPISKENTSNVMENLEGTLLIEKKENCYASEAWDCTVPCTSSDSEIKDRKITHIKLENSTSTEKLTYKFNITQSSCKIMNNPRIKCKGGFYKGNCRSLFKNGYFWLYLIIYTVTSISHGSVFSICDAICMDTVGKNGNYGSQRTFGTIGWGTMAPISGALVDWWSSDDSYTKNYLPAVILVAVFGSIDVFITTKLKVPRFEDGSMKIWRSMANLLKHTQILIFTFFIIMQGLFNGIVTANLFVLQEEMARNTEYMKYIKVIQGSTLAIQCLFEAPFMLNSKWFIKRIGCVGLIKLSFFFYSIRILALGFIGSYGPVWATLIFETLHGFCFGLGCPGIVVLAGNLTPPGTSATVQSFVDIFYALGVTLSNFLGGLVFHRYGAPAVYYIFGVICTITLGLYVFADMVWLHKINHLSNKDETGNKLRKGGDEHKNDYSLEKMKNHTKEGISNKGYIAEK